MINYNISTTGGDDNSAPQDLNLLQTGIGTQDIHVIGDKYAIDIYGDMLSYKPQDTAILTLLEGIGAESWGNPYPTWNDDYNGNLWADLKFDTLRTSYNASTAASENAGSINWISGADGTTAVTELALIDTVLKIAFIQTDSNIIGKKEYFVRNMSNLLSNLNYTPKANGTGAEVTDGTQNSYVADTLSTPLYVTFEDFAFHDGSNVQQQHQIIAKVKSFCWGDTGLDVYCGASTYDAYAFGMELDFTDSNVEDITSTSTILLEEVSNNASTVTTGYMHFSRMGLIGDSQTPAEAIPEGSNFTTGGNYNYSVENLQNKTQIFDTPKYGVTGTRQASTARFFDEFQLSRGRHLSMYKQKINGTMLRGVQSETFDATTGKPKRTMSGILDYSTFPIRYMKETLPSTYMSDTTGVALGDWIDHLVYSLMAFRQTGGSATFTVLCSRNVLNKLSRANSVIGTSSGNILGGIFTVVPPSKITLGLRVFEYESIYGTIRFVHEPSFDLMPILKVSDGANGIGGVPAHLFGSGLNPREILMILDKAYIKKVNFRPDKIYGNIQDIGQDAFEEAMRGECSLKLRFPRNHAIIDISA